MKFLKEITEDYAEESIDLMEAISQAVRELKLQKKGGKVNNKLIKDFIRKNPSLTQAAAIDALASYKMYKTNTRNTISLYAKSAYDKRMTTKMVKSLTDSKMFKLHRVRYSKNVKYWELKKVKSGF